MDLLFNELSVHKQFKSHAEFETSISTIMSIRKLVKDRFDKEIYHNGVIGNSYPLINTIMQQAIGKLTKDKARSIRIWLNNFYYIQKHSNDDCFECFGKKITGSSVGEAGYRNFNDEKCCLVSISPSDWCCRSVKVSWVHGEGKKRDHVLINNFIDWNSLETALEDQEPPIRSWSQLKTKSIKRYKSLYFSKDSFDPLEGTPFNQSCANSFENLFGILNTFVDEHDENGERTKEGHQIFKDYFHGDSALFSDSSVPEKRDFKEKMTFHHPENPQGPPLLCTMHGKIRHQVLRFHFSWPIKNGKIFIVYAGPKITKR